MPWMDWIALKHSAFVHLPLAAALLSPVALVAAQRPGRGIKPWWVTCRYLAWAGVLGAFTAAVSGLAAAHAARLLTAGRILSRGDLRNPTLFQLHQWIAASSLVLGVLMLRALHRKRQEHQGIGLLGLFTGLLWAGTTLAAGFFGMRLSRPVPVPVAVAAPAPAAPATRPVPAVPAGEPAIPTRALDYQGLVAIHPEPVKSVPHGNRWIRVWTSPGAEAAYREGGVLPPGALVVMSSVEDRWGRPGYDPGPLYILETRPGGKSSLAFYWPRVPEARRNETHGQDRVYWRGEDENLKACLACHAGGTAPLKDRSRWGIPRPKAPVPSPE